MKLVYYEQAQIRYIAKIQKNAETQVVYSIVYIRNAIGVLELSNYKESKKKEMISIGGHHFYKWYIVQSLII